MSTGCWIWTGTKTKKGYGTYKTKEKTYVAHRFFFQEARGFSPQVIVHTCKNTLCCNPDHMRGITKTENRQRLGLNNTEDMFWLLVDSSKGEESCWEWVGPRTKRGYGSFKLFGKTWPASRLAFYLTTKRLPKCVCHKCDNPPCCNPKHLFEGDHAINSRDMIEKGRMPRGSQRAWAKLTEKDVLEIRKRKELGDTLATLAKDYGIAFQTVSQICRKEIWKHV